MSLQNWRKVFVKDRQHDVYLTNESSWAVGSGVDEGGQRYITLSRKAFDELNGLVPIIQYPGVAPDGVVVGPDIVAGLGTAEQILATIDAAIARAAVEAASAPPAAGNRARGWAWATAGALGLAAIVGVVWVSRRSDTKPRRR